MAVSAALLNALATEAASLITHVALVDDTGSQVGDREAVTATASGADVRLDADVTFDVPAGATVAGWTAHDGATGGTDYGGADLTPEEYTGAGQYVLTGAGTGFTINAN